MSLYNDVIKQRKSVVNGPYLESDGAEEYAPPSASSSSSSRVLSLFQGDGFWFVRLRLSERVPRHSGGCRPLTFWDWSCVSPASRPKREWDQHQENQKRGPLRLLETPIKGTQRHHDICAHEEDEKLRDAIPKEVGRHRQDAEIVARVQTGPRASPR